MKAGILMRERGAVILIQNNKVALIKRVRNGSTYYVFPGGGVEPGETPEKAAEREAMEELGLEVKVLRCIDRINFNGIQYFFLAEIRGGNFGSGSGEEYIDPDRNRGTYLPLWVDLDELDSINIIPKKIAEKIQSEGNLLSG